MFSPVTGQTRPILPGLHKSKQEDSKGERQEERVREAHGEKSGDLGGSWGYLGRRLGRVGGTEHQDGCAEPSSTARNIKRVTLSLLPQSPFLCFFALEGVTPFMFFAMAEGSGHSS